MSRSGSRYPSAYGHTPSYRSYMRGTVPSEPIGYSVNLPGVGASSNLGLSNRSGLGSDFTSGLGSDYSSGLSRSGLGTGLGSSSLGRSYDMDLTLPSFSSGGRDLDTYGGYSGSSNMSKVTKSSYSSVSDSTRDGGRPIVEYSKDDTYRSTLTGPSGIPHSSYSHQASSYSSEDPYKTRTSSYSYNI